VTGILLPLKSAACIQSSLLRRIALTGSASADAGGTSGVTDASALLAAALIAAGCAANSERTHIQAALWHRVRAWQHRYSAELHLDDLPGCAVLTDMSVEGSTRV